MAFDQNSGRPNEGPFRGWALLAIGMTAAGGLQPSKHGLQTGLRPCGRSNFCISCRCRKGKDRFDLP
jgi:hypothetical protein